MESGRSEEIIINYWPLSVTSVNYYKLQQSIRCQIVALFVIFKIQRVFIYT
jgi:hypothetical protein